MSNEKWIFAATATGFAGFGIALLIFPGLLGVVGIKELSRSGEVEIRAVYGGLQIGLGLFFLLAFNRPRWARAGLVVQICSVGGLAIGRIFGLLVAGWAAKPFIYLILAVELILVILGANALIELNKTKKKNDHEAPQHVIKK